MYSPRSRIPRWRLDVDSCVPLEHEPHVPVPGDEMSVSAKSATPTVAGNKVEEGAPKIAHRTVPATAATGVDSSTKRGRSWIDIPQTGKKVLSELTLVPIASKASVRADRTEVSKRPSRHHHQSPQLPSIKVNESCAPRAWNETTHVPRTKPSRAEAGHERYTTQVKSRNERGRYAGTQETSTATRLAQVRRLLARQNSVTSYRDGEGEAAGEKTGSALKCSQVLNSTKRPAHDGEVTMSKHRRLGWVM